MHRFLFSTCMFCLLSLSSFAQAKNENHLLDGTSIDYVYKTAGAVHVELSDGQFHWHWKADGNTGSAPYRAQKLGDKTYMVNFKVAGNSNFVTIVFNFGKKVFYTSALFAPKTKDEQILFETGRIKQFALKEH